MNFTGALKTPLVNSFDKLIPVKFEISRFGMGQFVRGPFSKGVPSSETLC